MSQRCLPGTKYLLFATLHSVLSLDFFIALGFLLFFFVSNDSVAELMEVTFEKGNDKPVLGNSGVVAENMLLPTNIGKGTIGVCSKGAVSDSELYPADNE